MSQRLILVILIYHVFGDIIICTDVAQEQANNYGHSFERNWDFSITWILHLLGYDHMTEADENVWSTRYNIKRIWINTRLIMKGLNMHLMG